MSLDDGKASFARSLFRLAQQHEAHGANNRVCDFVQRSRSSLPRRLPLSMRRFTRLTNAFSKKPDNHIHALALYFAFYNFCRIHKTLRVSPAMAASVTDRLWSLEDIVAKIDAMAPPPKPRGPYKKRSG